jgi:drug/metabolite transporter (DMT)-like permease
MPYILVLLIALMWSFVGVLVKYAAMMVDSGTITLCRFLFGVFFLALLLKAKQQKILFYWKNKWVWIAAIGKCVNYIFENIAISIGFAYGNVIVLPVQTMFLSFISILYFKEELYFRKISAVLLCVIGVMLVSWKGAPLSELLSSGFITILFVISAIGAGIHIIGQKKLIDHMDSANMNFSIFLLSTFITAVPVPYTFHSTGSFSIVSAFSLIALGFITGISFYINAKVLKKIPLLVSAIISNCSVLFTLFWAWLFFREPINQYVILGAITFVLGIILLSIPRKTNLPANNVE